MINIRWSDAKWDKELKKWFCTCCKQEVDVSSEQLQYAMYAEESDKQRAYEENNYDEA